LQLKCAGGDNPCATNAGRGFVENGDNTGGGVEQDTGGGVAEEEGNTGGVRGSTCDAQCYSPLAGRVGCSAGPSDPVEAASGEYIYMHIVELQYQYSIQKNTSSGGDILTITRITTTTTTTITHACSVYYYDYDYRYYYYYYYYCHFYYYYHDYEYKYY